MRQKINYPLLRSALIKDYDRFTPASELSILRELGRFDKSFAKYFGHFWVDYKQQIMDQTNNYVEYLCNSLGCFFDPSTAPQGFTFPKYWWPVMQVIASGVILQEPIAKISNRFTTSELLIGAAYTKAKIAGEGNKVTTIEVDDFPMFAINDPYRHQAASAELINGLCINYHVLLQRIFDPDPGQQLTDFNKLRKAE